MPPQHLAPKRSRHRSAPAHLAPEPPSPPGPGRAGALALACVAAVPATLVASSLPAAAAPAARPTSYVVRRGDSLGGIAGRYGLTAAQLATANRRTVRATLVIGTRLTIPPLPRSTATPAAPTATPRLPAALRNDPARLAMAPVLRKAAKGQGVPTDLLMALCWQESGWQPKIVSSAGAVGLCQVLPTTADHLGRTALHRTIDPRKPQDNADAAAAYLRILLRRYSGSTSSTLTAYFAGPGRADAGYRSRATDQYIANITALRPGFATIR